jgi:hypothetical protein
MLKRALVLAFMVAMLGLVLFAQQKEFTKEVKHVPVKQTSAASGKEMYNMYCAVCHGTTGKGGGPAADALKTVPTDLTTLTKNERRKVPFFARGQLYPWRHQCAGSRQQGHADLGQSLLAYEPGARGRSTASGSQSHQLHRIVTGKVVVQAGPVFSGPV